MTGTRTSDKPMEAEDITSINAQDVAAPEAGPATARGRRNRGRRRTGYIYKKNDTRFYWMGIGFRGRMLHKSTGETDGKKAAARLRAWCGELDAADAGYTTVPGPEANRVTVNERLDWLEGDYELRRVRSLPQVRSHLVPIREWFGPLKAVDVAARDVDDYIRARAANRVAPVPGRKRRRGHHTTRKARLSAATINRGLQLLGQALRPFLQEHGRPVPKIRRLPEDNAREGFAERAEFEAIVRALPEDLQDFARWQYATAWRPGESKSLKWADVERDARAIRLSWRSAKTKKARRMALEGDLWALIERRWAGRVVTAADGSQAISPLVFHRDGRQVGNFSKAWKTACGAAGAPQRHLYDFRRSGLRNMVRAGVDPAIAMKISGHRTRATFDRYNIVSDDDIRDAMAKTSAYLRQQPSEPKVLLLRAAEEKR